MCVCASDCVRACACSYARVYLEGGSDQGVGEAQDLGEQREEELMPARGGQENHPVQVVGLRTDGGRERESGVRYWCQRVCVCVWSCVLCFVFGSFR